MTKLTLTELTSQSVELLPTRDTLILDANWAEILASNTSMAANIGTLCSSATSAAVQVIGVSQS